MDLSNIKRRIKNNEKVGFYAEGMRNILLMESILLDNGCRWRGANKNYSILTQLPSEHSLFTKMWIFLDCEIGNPRIISYSTYETSVDDNTVEVSKIPLRKLNDLFINEPTYKPKKIERTL